MKLGLSERNGIQVFLKRQLGLPRFVEDKTKRHRRAAFAGRFPPNLQVRGAIDLVNRRLDHARFEIAETAVFILNSKRSLN